MTRAVAPERGPAGAIDQLETKMMASFRGIPQDGGRRVEGAGDDVGAAVAIQVGHGQPAAEGRLPEPGSGGRGDIRQRDAGVPQQGRPHGEGRAQPLPIEHMAVRLEQVERDRRRRSRPARARSRRPVAWRP